MQNQKKKYLCALTGLKYKRFVKLKSMLDFNLTSKQNSKIYRISLSGFYQFCQYKIYMK